MAYGRVVRTCFLALLVAAFLTAGACGDDDDDADRAPATSDTPAGTSTEAAAAKPLPRAPGPLPPGAYTTAAFTPTVSFSIGRGWRVLAPEDRTFATLVHGADQDPLLAFVRPVRVIDPRRRYTGEVPEDALLPLPDDLVEWLARHPRLNASGRKAVTVGGVRGTQIDIAVESPYPACLDPCVLFFATSPDFTVQAAESQKIRATRLEVEGQQILIGILASERRFAALVPVAERVVETIKFR
jgi:hypothetical protein